MRLFACPAPLSTMALRNLPYVNLIVCRVLSNQRFPIGTNMPSQMGDCVSIITEEDALLTNLEQVSTVPM